jgi:phage FluMu protein Com
MKAIYCDKCGKFLDDDEMRQWVQISLSLQKTVELCDYCNKRFLEVFLTEREKVKKGKK